MSDEAGSGVEVYRTIHEFARKRSLRKDVRKCLFRRGLGERDTGVEPVSQPWEGWAQPIYQSRNTRNSNTLASTDKTSFLAELFSRHGVFSLVALRFRPRIGRFTASQTVFDAWSLRSSARLSASVKKLPVPCLLPRPRWLP